MARGFDLDANTTAVTQTAGDNSTKVATTAYVAAAISGIGGGGGRWATSAIPTDAAVQTAKTIDFADAGATLTGYTWANQGAATAAIQRKRLVMVSPATTTGTTSRRVFYPPSANQLPTSGNWCVQAPVTLLGATNFNMAGLWVKGATLGRSILGGNLIRGDAGVVYTAWLGRHTSETALSSDVYVAGDPFMVIAIGYDGTNITVYFSPDGRDWCPAPHYTETTASFIGAGPYTYAFYVDSISAKQSAGAFENAVVLNQATPVPHGQFV